jgi:hypothetical protein
MEHTPIIKDRFLKCLNEYIIETSPASFILPASFTSLDDKLCLLAHAQKLNDCLVQDGYIEHLVNLSGATLQDKLEEVYEANIGHEASLNYVDLGDVSISDVIIPYDVYFDEFCKYGFDYAPFDSHLSKTTTYNVGVAIAIRECYEIIKRMLYDASPARQKRQVNTRVNRSYVAHQIYWHKRSCRLLMDNYLRYKEINTVWFIFGIKYTLVVMLNRFLKAMRHDRVQQIKASKT